MIRSMLVAVALVGCDGVPNITETAWLATRTPYPGPIVVGWNQSRRGVVHVEYRLDGEWRRTPDLEGRRGPNTTTVMGLPFGETAPYRVVVGDGSVTFDGETELVAFPEPNAVPELDIEISEPELWGPSGEYVLLPINDNGEAVLVILDRQGRVVWGTTASNIYYTELSGTGVGVMWGDTVREVSIRTFLDAPIEERSTPGHYHAMAGLPDGTLVWDSASTLFQLPPGASEPRQLWSSGEISYLNGITYDPGSGRFGLSSFTAQSFAFFDPPSRSLLWSAPGFTSPQIYRFQPSDRRFINPPWHRSAGKRQRVGLDD